MIQAEKYPHAFAKKDQSTLCDMKWRSSSIGLATHAIINLGGCAAEPQSEADTVSPDENFRLQGRHDLESAFLFAVMWAI
jgi:hypothetical protein